MKYLLYSSSTHTEFMSLSIQHLCIFVLNNEHHKLLK